MKIVLSCLLLAILFHPGQSTDESAQSFKRIPIATKENGYNNFESIVFTSQKDLDSFLTKTATQSGWNRRQEFVDALLNAKLDFSKEHWCCFDILKDQGLSKSHLKRPFYEIGI